ncbi:genetic suppressor element 1-like [Notothenia coriiceps]|uniref:Genetic suppressor element 1-like n=1 Tax=Notothenia coriiceps TaxID=8208 RepID=A0A6I9NJJ8_9TELE|nr:PREDICTED: genetic suppressor element 1-like [Notothenia coriiceps]
MADGNKRSQSSDAFSDLYKLSIPNHHEPGSRDLHPHLGAPPPLISPKPPQPPREHHPPTTLWNPASLIDTASESRRNHEPSGMGHYELSRLPPGHAKYEDGARRREGGVMEKYPPLRGPPGLPEPSTFLADLEKSTQSFFSQQRATLSLPSQYEMEGGMKSNAGLKSLQGHPGHSRHGQGLGIPPGTGMGQVANVGTGPETMLIYDEYLQQHRRPVSKLDLEEKRRKEAREKGYYYELDDSYDESDEEEVRAHLRRVAEQPPLKLEDSSEKLDFLGVFGLTTVGRRDELVQQKRRKRRRRLRERSPSPSCSQPKRTPPPAPQLSTRFTPEDMNRAPELEDKKRFLTTFSLSHVTVQQRRDSALAQPPSESEGQHSVRPQSPSSYRPASPNGHPKPLGETLRPKEPPSPAVYPDKARGPGEGPVSKRSSSLLNSLRPPLPLQAKEGPHSVNGRTKPWDSFTPEEFAQQFHESVLQSTQKALQKHKGGAAGMSESSHLQESSVHYNIPELQSAPGRPPQHSQSHSNAHPFPHPLSHAHPQPNGQHFSAGLHREASGAREDLSGPEDSEEDQEEEEEEAPVSKWQGIESIFEAYQEYVEEQGLERHVLQSQCRRLEAQNYNLSLTAEQLSHNMGELMSQRQKLAVEREKLQAELEHFRKCLTLPQTHWPRGGHYKGYPPR